MKKELAKISSKVSVAAATLVTGFVNKSFAQDPSTWIQNISKGRTGDDLGTFITDLINWGIGFAALVAVVMLIAAGFMYITANGDENKIKKATTTLTFAIVGLVVCFIAVLLVNFVIKEFLEQ